MEDNYSYGMKARQKCRGLFSKSNPDSTAYIGSGKILFDIPVYRLPKEQYESQQNAFIQEKLDCSKFAEEAYRRYPEMKGQDKNHLWEIYGGGWLFNEICGFLRLYFLGTQIWAEYYPVVAKRITRTRRKTFSPLGYEVTGPVTIPQGSSNQEIFNLILNFLARANGEKELTNRHFYSALLENIGHHIDWNTLLEEQFRR